MLQKPLAQLSLLSLSIFMWSATAGAFVNQNIRNTPSFPLPQGSVCKYSNNGKSFSSSWKTRVSFSKNMNKANNEIEDSTTTRRKVFFDTANLLTATTISGCSFGCCSPAYGLAKITTPSAAEVSKYDVARDPLEDAAFAQGMAMGMKDYEKEAYPKKKELFQKLFASILEGDYKKKIKDENEEQPVVVEIGIGSFPNALYYQKANVMGGLDIIGVDPNDKMERYARKNASVLTKKYNDNLRIVHGVSEALPLATNSCDAVVCSLTLCSVIDPAKSLKEIKRILKPGGKFLFWEHVLSQTDPDFAQQQIALTPQQMIRADGCHLNRQTGETIKSTGFKKLDMEYLELKNFGYLNPTVCGIATA